MLRIGKLYFGWGKPAPDVRFLPEIMVCRDEQHAKFVRRQLGQSQEVRVITPRISQICGISPAKITVMPGVDLDVDVLGEGSLRDLLRSRQAPWGNRAVFVEL